MNSMDKLHPIFCALPVAMLALLASCSPAEQASAQTSHLTTEDDVYTVAQAKRGKVIHTRACAQCHANGYYKGRKLIESWS